MAEVWHDESAGVWLLEMPASCYAFGLAGDGTAIRHLHWGPRSQLAAIAGLAGEARAEPSSWERYRTWAAELPDEYVPWGGIRYDEPTLKADYPDGTRGVVLSFTGHRLTPLPAGMTLEVDLADPAYDLLATLHYRIYHGFDVLERWVTLRNDGPGPVHVRQALSANWWLPTRRDWRLRYLHGGWGAETQLAEANLVPGKLVLESRRGTTSHEFNPWFTLDADGAATEESGQVWSGELAWSGSWKLVYELTAAGRVHVCGGWNDFDAVYQLAPGEELTTPPFAALYTSGGFGAASREWHRWQLAHVLGRGDRTSMLTRPAWAPADEPESGAEQAAVSQLRPVLYNSWEATAFAVSHAGQERLAELAAELGIECFVVDDGWFRGRQNDRAGLGDWTVDRDKFPAGLTPLIKRVTDLGMRFGLWVEPEMVNPDSDLYREHPDWAYHFAGRTRSLHRNQQILNLARPDVAEWVFGTLDTLLTEHDIRFVKWDMNRHFSEPGWPEAAGRNPERIWVDHVRHLYAILDALRAAHPGVEFESCSGGGGRVDLGILGRVEQVWTSDNTDAWDRVLIQHGFSQAYTPQVMMAWVTDNPNWLTRRRLPLRFQFHSAMAGSLGIGADLNAWTATERAEAVELIAEYKAIRPVIQQGGLYRLASVGGAPFQANQYLAGDGSELVVLGWWGPAQCGSGLHRLRLAGLDPAATYRDASAGQEHQGGALMHEGLQLPTGIGNDFGSMLVRLTRL